MTDTAGLDTEETGPERTCIVTRVKGDPQRMLRFVVGPEETVVPDVRARLPGRGAWVQADAATVDLAVKRKAFKRAFRRDVVVRDDLSAQVEALLSRDALQALALANKAGRVVCGAVKVEAALAGGGVAGLLHASDGSADGIRKIAGAARRSIPPDRAPPVAVQIFPSSQLDLALGRANVIHAALLIGGVSDAFLQRAARLERFRGLAVQHEAGASDVPALDVI